MRCYDMKVPRKPFDVVTSQLTADQWSMAQFFSRWRNSICNFCSHFRYNIYVLITRMLKILSRIETYTKCLSPQNKQILPRSSPLKVSPPQALSRCVSNFVTTRLAGCFCVACEHTVSEPNRCGFVVDYLSKLPEDSPDLKNTSGIVCGTLRGFCHDQAGKQGAEKISMGNHSMGGRNFVSSSTSFPRGTMF